MSFYEASLIFSFGLVKKTYLLIFKDSMVLNVSSDWLTLSNYSLLSLWPIEPTEWTSLTIPRSTEVFLQTHILPLILLAEQFKPLGMCVHVCLCANESLCSYQLSCPDQLILSLHCTYVCMKVGLVLKHNLSYILEHSAISGH